VVHEGGLHAHRTLAASQYAVLKTVTDWSNYINFVGLFNKFRTFLITKFLGILTEELT